MRRKGCHEFSLHQRLPPHEPPLLIHEVGTLVSGTVVGSGVRLWDATVDTRTREDHGAKNVASVLTIAPAT